jgi:hypothetical protein
VQGPIKCALVILAAAAVLSVLITPALDELPCTVGKRAPHLTALVWVAAISPLAPFLSSAAVYLCNKESQFSRAIDVLSSNCTLLC